MMIKLIFLFVISFIIAFFQLKPLVQQRRKKDIWVYSVLYLLAMVITSLMIMGVPIPTPLKLIEWMYSPLVKPLL